VANLAATRQDEVFITRGNESGAEARAIQRRAKQGELNRIAEGVYIHEKEPEAQKTVVRRNWFRILGTLAPGAVVSYRSAYAGGITPDGVVHLSPDLLT
jgi:predicted transcriptional regulator of viral defense system